MDEEKNVGVVDEPTGHPKENAKQKLNPNKHQKNSTSNTNESKSDEGKKPHNKSKQKRLRRKHKKRKSLKMNLIGNNVDGILKKLESLENLIQHENPAVIFLQETQVKRAGRIQTPSASKFTWYEFNRTKNAEKGYKGGGVAIGVHNKLEPSYISEGDDDAEALTVEVWIEDAPIRLICGYGPQEYDGVKRKDKFWSYLHSEVQNAQADGAGVIIQMDGNCWAGSEVIQDDPKPQNNNGRRFHNFLKANQFLNVINALPICDGRFTRIKHTKNGVQKSMIDFFVVCDKMLPFVTKMTIDEKGENILTRYRGRVAKSDHRILKLEMDLQFHIQQKHERTVFFNLKNENCQAKFSEIGSKDKRFSTCFYQCEESIHTQFKRWQRKFNKAIHACFRKIRITNKTKENNSEIDQLMNEKKKLLRQKVIKMEDLKRVDNIEKQITKELEDEELEKIQKVLGEMETGKGHINSTNVWKEMKKAYPKKNKPLPTGVKNIRGKLITNPDEKKKVTLEHFVHRMRKRPVKEEFNEEIKENKKLLEKRLTEAKQKKSPPFEMKELEGVLKSLKTGKSKDPDNYIRELFRTETIGSDLKLSILMMMNKMKEQVAIPDALKRANITILHKKDCKLDLKNWRGIFVSSVLRTILMKLLHERAYPKINSNMTDAQIGARRNKSVRNHLFVLNAILSDVLSSTKKEPIDLHIMDYKQMFDAEDLDIALNAVYEAGVTDDTLALIKEANKTNTFAVKTPNGLTEIRTINNKIMQGDVLAPLVSSNMVDVHICKVAKVTGNVYLYKGQVEIPPLAMQDDTLGISTCGRKSKEMNKFLNDQTNKMNLQYGSEKCVKMHIEKKHKTLDKPPCPELSVDMWKDKVAKDGNGKDILVDEYSGQEPMKDVQQKKYLGNIITNDSTNSLNIKDRTNKAMGNVDKIITGLIERPYGKNTYRAGKIMREAMLIGAMLNNTETWNNITKDDINQLTKPDTILQRKLLATSGNPCKVFMNLELGIIPVRYVIMGNRTKYLNYILNEDIGTTVRDVFETQKRDSRKGDFVNQVNQDLEELKIDLTEEEIKLKTKSQWKEYIDLKVKEAALKYLNTENSKMEKTKDIQFNELKLNEYLYQNRETSLTKIIFSTRSGTLDIKAWNPWKYKDSLCVGCGNNEETMSHFMSCTTYGIETECIQWKDIYIPNVEVQNKIAFMIRKRLELRDTILEADATGQDSMPGSNAPNIC